jgi:hypothetical protein
MLLREGRKKINGCEQRVGAEMRLTNAESFIEQKGCCGAQHDYETIHKYL